MRRILQVDKAYDVRLNDEVGHCEDHSQSCYLGCFNLQTTYSIDRTTKLLAFSRHTHVRLTFWPMMSSLDVGLEGVDILLDDEMVGTNRARRSHVPVRYLILPRLANKAPDRCARR